MPVIPNSSTITHDRSTAASIILALLALAPTAAAFLVYLNTYSLGRQRMALLLALATLAALTACWAGYGPSRFLRQRATGSPVVLMSILSLAILSTAMLWANLFIAYSASTEHNGGIFRGVFACARGPLYGQPNKVLNWYTMLSIGIGGAILAEVAHLCRKPPASLRAPVLRLMVLHLMLISSIAMSDSPQRLLEPVEDQLRFQQDLSAFHGIADLMRNYVAKMPSLSTYTWHYPPGMFILFMVEEALAVPGLVKLLLLLAVVATIVPIAALVHELNEGRGVAFAAHALLVTSSAPLLYATTASSPMLMLFAATSLWLVARALRHGAWPGAVLVGMVMAIYTLFSFGVVFFGATLALICLVGIAIRACRFVDVVKLAVLSLATYVMIFGALRAFSGFDVIGCLQAATANNYRVMGPAPFLDAPARWLLQSTGNLLAYLVSLGLPLSALVLVAITRPPKALATRTTLCSQPLTRAFVLGTAVGLLPAAFSGVFFLETERVWLFFTPGMILGAAVVLDRWRRAHGDELLPIVVGFSICLSCIYGLAFTGCR